MNLEALMRKEKERIEALQRHHILDTPPDGAFDRVTALAAKLFNVPISIASLVDTDRIWFKSHHGIDVQQTDRVPGLCDSVILNNVPYILNDASLDPRSLANPLVAGEFSLRFYVGIPLITHDKHNIGVLSIIDFEPRDISEDDLESLKHLAQIIMDEMELRLAARKIDELSKEKANLLAVLGHEILTPLNGVLGMASILQSTELNDEQHECVEIIETSGQSLLTMIDHILNYSKIDSGKMEVIHQMFDLRNCMKEAIKLFTAEIMKKGIVINCEIDPKIPILLKGDEQKIGQILINLLGNAVKFTKKGTIVVSVKMLSLDGKYANISFAVKDSGIGIDNNQVHRLFQTFSQVHAYVPGENYGGTGLGLSICKQLVGLMNGRIWLEESSTNGSIFMFELKIVYSHSE